MAAAAARLRNHHGSMALPPPAVNRKVDWLCNKCGPDKRTFGTKGGLPTKSCHWCGGSKGECHAGPAPRKSAGGVRDRPSVARDAKANANAVTTVEATQVRLAKEAQQKAEVAAKKDRVEVDRLRKENKVLQQAAANAGTEPPATATAADEAGESSAPSGPSLATLRSVRDALREDGAGDDDETLASVLAKINGLEERDKAAKPLDQRLRAAQGKVNRLQGQLVKDKAAWSTLESKEADLRKEMELLQQKVRDGQFALVEAKREAELVAAEVLPQGAAPPIAAGELQQYALGLTEDQYPAEVSKAAFELLLQQFLDGFAASRAAAMAAGTAQPKGAEGKPDVSMGASGLHVPVPDADGRDGQLEDSQAVAQLRAQLAAANQAAADSATLATVARAEAQRLADAHGVEIAELRGEANVWGKALLDAAGVEKERCQKVLAEAVERDAERDRERDKRRKAAAAQQ